MADDVTAGRSRMLRGATVPNKKFQQVFQSQNHSGVLRTGVQLSPIQANSPLKSWRLIFTNNILEKIVRYTNAYGKLHTDDWQDIDQTDVTDFISTFLFAMSIQRRKDKPSNWFSNNPLLESPIAKKITTGSQFEKMMRYLHVCNPSHKSGTTANTIRPTKYKNSKKT
jgi:hypothetical protein